MVCIFCIAVLMLVGGALTAQHLDKMEDGLAERAVDGRVRRTADTDAVVKWELTVKIAKRSIPVAVTVFKDLGRARIQILTHELTREEVEQVENMLAEALEATVIDRSDPAHEDLVQHEAEHAAAADPDQAALTRAERKGVEQGTAPPSR
jgi:hypothetical protein